MCFVSVLIYFVRVHNCVRRVFFYLVCILCPCWYTWYVCLCAFMRVGCTYYICLLLIVVLVLIVQYSSRYARAHRCVSLCICVWFLWACCVLRHYGCVVCAACHSSCCVHRTASQFEQTASSRRGRRNLYTIIKHIRSICNIYNELLYEAVPFSSVIAGTAVEPTAYSYGRGLVYDSNYSFWGSSLDCSIGARYVSPTKKTISKTKKCTGTPVNNAVAYLLYSYIGITVFELFLGYIYKTFLFIGI